MSRTYPFFALVGVAVCFWGGAARASAEKTPLTPDVIVSGKSIYLSDLLPISSPASIRSEGREILIGSSPQPGGMRVLSGDEIVRLLTGLNLLTQVSVPEQIVVHRAGYLITRDEVVQAIQRTMNGNAQQTAGRIAPLSVRLAAHLFVSMQDPDLRVTRIEPERTLGETEYWLVSDADPTIRPFLATVSAGCDACKGEEKLQSADRMQARPNAASGPSNMSVGHPASAESSLVEAGKLVRLHLFSESGTQMYLSAMSLERGTLGQNIRVKIRETGKILTARVTGHGQLEAEY